MREVLRDRSNPLELQQRVDTLLAKPQIALELLQTKSVAYERRCFGTGKKPRFFYLAAFDAALYHKDSQNVFTGSWDLTHNRLSTKVGLTEKGTIMQYQDICISGDMLQLRGQYGSKIFCMNTDTDLSARDVNGIAQKGYLLLSPFNTWIIPDRQTGRGYREIPSPLVVNVR